MAEKGSIPTGPSEQYLRLLKGEITPEEYAKSVEKRARGSQHSEHKSNGNGAVERKRA